MIHINASDLQNITYNSEEKYLVNCTSFNEDELSDILEFTIKNGVKNNFVLKCSFENYDRARWITVTGNRLRIPLYFEISDKETFLKLFDLWTKTEKIGIPIYPFQAYLTLYLNLIMESKAVNILKNVDEYTIYSIENHPLDYLLSGIKFVQNTKEIKDFLNLLKDEVSLKYTDEIIDIKYTTNLNNGFSEKKSIINFITVNKPEDFYKLHSSKFSGNNILNIVICNFGENINCYKCKELYEFYNYVLYSKNTLCKFHTDKINSPLYKSLLEKINTLKDDIYFSM